MGDKKEKTGDNLGAGPFMAYCQFVTGLFVSYAKFLPDEIYQFVLDCIVVSCVDIVVVDHRGKMFLGKRSIEPQPDWWIIGGRMRPGESFEEAASRNIQRELGLEIDTSRFVFSGRYNLIWGKREQEPQDHGCHTTSDTHVLVLNEDEAAMVRVTGDEYSDSRWQDLEEVAECEAYHRCLRQMAIDALDVLIVTMG